ncbi:MAG: DUF2490 domain-containing protein [Aureispira sp.]|nr:DUF2490 domain-containing protein [Aureispira sp.]
MKIFNTPILLFVLSLSLLVSTNSTAQSSTSPPNNFNGWYYYVAQIDISPKWGIHFDGQIRVHNIIERFSQSTARAALLYRFTPSTYLAAGYAIIPTQIYPEGYLVPEQRIYQEFKIKSKKLVKDIQLCHRIRSEQRFFGLKKQLDEGEEFVHDKWLFKDRFRYKLGAGAPIKKFNPDLGNKLCAGGSAEIFLSGYNLNNKGSLLDQYRTEVFMDYAFNKVVSLNLAYINELKFNGNDIKMINHNFKLTLKTKLQFYKKSK